MGNMRTLAFQVPEELFQRIKDYLQRNNMTQKEFVIGLIESEINRDLTQRAALSEEMTEEQPEVQETATEGDCESVLEETEQEYEEQGRGEIEEQDESENMTMSMGMWEIKPIRHNRTVITCSIVCDWFLA